MKSVYPIFRKEMSLYFVSPIAYVVAGVFLVLTGFFFQTLSQMGMTAAATGVLAGGLGVGGAALPAGSAFLTGAKGAASGGAGLLGQLKAGFGNVGKSLPTITKDAASNMGLMMVTGVGSLTGATQMTKQLGFAGWRLKAPTNTATKVKASLVTGGGPAAVMRNVDGLLDPGTGRPAIRLAIQGRESDGWYDLGTIQVRSSQSE